ncbi:MAG: hypothetical protein JXA33_26970 [Anaerolineae bacterium]|nr:hypothetical protein [Anaerolineae bacterium]
MTEAIQMWVEVVFNMSYLIVVWGLVAAMLWRRKALPEAARAVAVPFIWAFGLLALGDTGHVGFRVLAYVLGDLETRFQFLGRQVGLVGLGALSTAITVTFFYIVILIIWQRRFNKPYGAFGYMLFAAAVVRLIVMIFPQNAWNSTLPPWDWSMYRNLPLMVQGLGVAYLILRDADVTQDRTFKWVGIMILVSYTFYTPVILFVQQMPMLGMLMIPKTLAYVAIAWIAFTNLFTVSPHKQVIV